MRVNSIFCDKCGQLVEVSQKVKVYDCSFHKGKYNLTTVKPKRKEYDLCFDCRLELIKWLGEKKNEEDKKSFLRRLLEVK